MLEMKDADFDSNRLCTYRNDISTLFVYSITKLLTIGIHTITLHTIDNKETSFKFWLTLFLFMDLPIIITTIIQGTYLVWMKDTLAVAIYLLAPIAFATIFRFYKTIFRTFYKLYIKKVFWGEPENINDFMTQLNNRLTSRKASATYLVIGSAYYFTVNWLSILMGSDPGWHYGLPITFAIYHKIWMLILTLASFSFVFKVIILWRTIRAIPIKMWEGTTEPHFIINLSHPDGAAGYNELSFLWLRVTMVGMIIGIGVILSATAFEWDLRSWIAAISYLLLAPFLVSAPFIYLHSLMASFKEAEIDEFYRILKPPKQNSKDPEKEDELRKRYNNLKKLPTWPFGWNIGKIYWGLAAFPAIPTIIGIIDSLN